MTDPDPRGLLDHAQEVSRWTDDDADLIDVFQTTLDGLPAITVDCDMVRLLAVRATLQWRLVAGWVRRHRVEMRAETRGDSEGSAALARAEVAQDDAMRTDGDLADWTARTGLAPEADLRAAVDRARGQALRAIAELPNPDPPRPDPPRPPGQEKESLRSWAELNRLWDQAREDTPAQEQDSDEKLVQAALSCAARSVATSTWEPEAERLLTTLIERLKATAGARDRLHETLMPAVHVMLLLVRVVARRTVPGAEPDQAARETTVWIARATELIDRIEDPTAPIDAVAVSTVQMLHLLLGGMMLWAGAVDNAAVDNAEDAEDAEVRRRQAEEHLANAPAGMRDAVEEFQALLRLHGHAQREEERGRDGGFPPDDASLPSDDSVEYMEEPIRSRYREISEELGIGLLEALRLTETAQRTRALPDIDLALNRVGAVLAGLPTPHPMIGQLLAMTAHLRAMRAGVTIAPADATAAVRASAQALAHVVAESSLPTAEPSPPGREVVHPVTEALLTCAMADPRGGGYDEAEKALHSVLERQDLDECSTLSARIGLGLVAALRWAGASDERLRLNARAALDAAREQLRVTAPSLESLQLGMGLLQFEMLMLAQWGDSDAFDALSRIADHLEPMLESHPDLRAQLDTMTGALNRPGPGLPDLTGGAGSLGLIRTVRQMSQMMHTLKGMTSGGPFAELFKGMLPTVDTAGPIHHAAVHAARHGGSPVPTDSVAMMQMMQAALAAMRGDPAAFRQHYGAATDTPPAPAQPSTSEADRALAQALTRLRDLLGEQRDARDVDAALEARRPLSWKGRADSDELRVALEAVRVARVAGVDPDRDHEAGDLLGVGLAELYWTGAARPEVLVEAVRLLRRARENEARKVPTLRLVDRWDVQACCYAELGRCGRYLNALDDVLAATRAALRELGRLVLLAPDTAQALRLAHRADRLVTRAIGWCLAERRGGDAVAIAEAGRGLVLAAATLSSGIAEVLEGLGQGDVAAAWRRGESKGLEEGLSVLSQTPEGLAMLRVPSAHDMTMALHAVDVEAIVYLVPPATVDPVPPGAPHRSVSAGQALVVTPGFTVDVVPLPGLDNENLPEVTFYLEAFTRALDVVDPTARYRCGFRGSPGGGAWMEALDKVGVWAHTTVIRPLLGHLGSPASGPVPEHPRHVALIPLGDLGAVPFAAAWTTDPLLPGKRRYAVHDLVLSQAASGRLLAQVARRRRSPIDQRPVFLVNGDEEFTFGQRASDAIVEHLYPEAMVFGPHRGNGQASPERLLSVLPHRGPSEAADAAHPDPEDGVEAGPASMLHLITHATVRDDDTNLLTSTRLQVREGSCEDETAWLSLGRILDQARGIDPGAPGGLVICDACVTDVTLTDRDESLTLATAFLAAGATGAIGTRWPVDDDTSAVFAVVLHHYLKQGSRPAQALRSAQRWMLASPRERETIPELPEELAKESTPRRWAESASWAAYVHHGL